MSHKIEIRKSAAKTLRKIPKPYRRRIRDRIDSLAENLPNPDVTKLKGNNAYNIVNYQLSLSEKNPPHSETCVSPE